MERYMLLRTPLFGRVYVRPPEKVKTNRRNRRKNGQILAIKTQFVDDDRHYENLSKRAIN
jgi:hypothetical protein